MMLKVAQQVIKLIVIGIGGLLALSTLGTFSAGVLFSLGVLGIALLLIGIFIGYYGMPKAASKANLPDEKEDTPMTTPTLGQKAVNANVYGPVLYPLEVHKAWVQSGVEVSMRWHPVVWQCKDFKESRTGSEDLNVKTFKVNDV